MEMDHDGDRKVVVVSGYFNPIHEGHIEYIRIAKEFAGENGLVYAIINSDKQARLNKNFSFVPERDRLAVVAGLKHVDRAIISIDEDHTVCKTLEMMCEDSFANTPTHFVNGGDVTAQLSCPEQNVCEKYGIQLVFGLGDTIQSSSWILDKSVKEAYEVLFTEFGKKLEIQTTKRHKVFH